MKTIYDHEVIILGIRLPSNSNRIPKIREQIINKTNKGMWDEKDEGTCLITNLFYYVDPDDENFVNFEIIGDYTKNRKSKNLINFEDFGIFRIA